MKEATSDHLVIGRDEGAGRKRSLVGWLLAIVEADAPRWRLPARRVMAIALIPVGIGMLGVISGLFGKEAYRWFTGEDGFAETLQVVCYLGALVLSVVVASRLRASGETLLAAMYLCVTAGLFFLVGEEISWGQRLFGWSTPEGLVAVNKQGETNLHNIYGVGTTFKWVQLLVGAYGGLLPLLAFQTAALRRHTAFLSWVLPPLSLGLFFLPMAVWKFYRNLWEAPESLYFAIAEFNEVVELMLAAGFLAFMVFQLRRVRRGDGGPR